MTNATLYLDIGNTSVDAALEKDGSTTYRKIPSADLMALETYLDGVLKDNASLSLAIAAVQMETLAGLKTYLEKKHQPYFLLTPEVMKAFALKHHYDIPNVSFLGQDIFCDVVSEESDKGLIVVDLGTATKVILLLPDKTFPGSSILPGVLLFNRILSQSTSLLKDKDVQIDPPIVSLQTDECLSSGAVLGTTAAVSGLVNRIKQEYHLEDTPVILTGGAAPFIRDKLADYGLKDVRYDPYWVIQGLKRVYSEMN